MILSMSIVNVNEIGQLEIIIYPVPADDELRVLWNKEGSQKVSIYNMQGQCIYVSAAANVMVLPTDTWADGVYVLISERDNLIQRFQICHSHN
jgi:hypothetical protein